MVIDTFRALNKLIFIEISEYWSLSAKTKQPFLILSWTKACVLIWSAMWKRDNFPHSWHLTTTLIKMGLCYVSSGMKLNSKSSLMVSFTYNSHSFCSWLNSSSGVVLTVKCMTFKEQMKGLIHLVYVKQKCKRGRNRFQKCQVSWNWSSFQRDNIDPFTTRAAKSSQLEMANYS